MILVYTDLWIKQCSIFWYDSDTVSRRYELESLVGVHNKASKIGKSEIYLKTSM